MHDLSEKIDKVSTPLGELSFNSQTRILHIKIREGADMSLQNAKTHYDLINEYIGNSKYLALVDASNFFTISKEAWKYASLKKVFSQRVAAAHYNSSFPNILAMKFYTAVHDTSVPLKLFNSEAEAREWLLSFPVEG